MAKAHTLVDNFNDDQINTTLAQANRLDFASRAHLSQTKSQIDRVLNAPHIQMPAMGRPMIIIGQPAGQGGGQ